MRFASSWPATFRGIFSLITLLAFCSTLFTSSLAGAAPKKEKEPPPPPPADADTAEQLYARLDFELANSVSERVIRKNGLSHSDLVRVYRILAITNAVLDKEEASREAFQSLLAYEPDFVVDANLGPKVSTPYSEAKGFWRSMSQKPGVDVQVAIRVGEGGTLRITTRDPTHMVKKMTVGQRWASSGEYATSSISVGDGVTVDVPPPPAGKTRLDYYVQALDDRDDVVIETGSAQVPKTAFAEAKGINDKPKDKSGGGFVGSTAFWVIAGAVLVAGAATGGYFLFRGQTAPNSATLSPAVSCGGAACN